MSGARPVERLTASIRAAGAEGRLALAPFVPAGFPSREGFAELLGRIEPRVEAIEIGVPFSDPMADGVTIQASSRAALDDGVTMHWILELLEAHEAAAPRVLMSYLNPLLSVGFDTLAERAPAAGIAAVIVPDLPYEESAALRAALDRRGLGLVQLVTPLTAPDRLERLCNVSSGFVYAVTTTGTTGAAVADDSGRAAYFDRVRSVSALPVMAGFGIREAGQLAALVGHVDGVIVGSALIELLARGDDPVAFLDELSRGGAVGGGSR